MIRQVLRPMKPRPACSAVTFEQRRGVHAGLAERLAARALPDEGVQRIEPWLDSIVESGAEAYRAMRPRIGSSQPGGGGPGL